MENNYGAGRGVVERDQVKAHWRGSHIDDCNFAIAHWAQAVKDKALPAPKQKL